MTATANRNNFKYVARPRLPVVGEVLLVSGWLFAIGLLNLFYAIAVIADSDIFITTASWLVGDARPWGWLMLVVALIQLMAAPALLMGRLWALGWGCSRSPVISPRASCFSRMSPASRSPCSPSTQSSSSVCWSS